MPTPIDTFKTSSPARQAILIGVMASIGAMAIFSIWYFLLRTPYDVAFSNIKSNDAVTIVAELDRLKTPYKLADDGTTIMVPQDKVDSARVNVLGGDLPLKGAVGFELFNKTDMGLTEFAQKINFQRALQGELARTIMALDDIDSARVHLSLPESAIFEQDKRKAKASVTIATKLGGPLSDKTVQGVQRLIASAVPELDPQNVAVLDAHGQLMSNEPTMTIMAPSDQPQKSALEQYFASKIQEAIQALGMGMPMRVDVVSFGQPPASTPSLASGTAGSSRQDVPQSVDSASTELRTAALKVTVSLASEPGPAIKDRLLAATQNAIGFNHSRGDLVVFALDPALAPPPSPRMDISAPPLRAPTMQKQGFSVSDLPIWLFAALFGFMLLILLAWRLLQPAVRLSSQDREAFSVKLRSLLDDEARDAQSSS